ncbi:MAG TPA: amidohydrolase, partial [Acidimicrobiia bacterium]|nr:amidohydrolase [Acidimicrobiia bacterium]
MLNGETLIIDADSHWTEPHDLFTRAAPPAYRDRVPRVETIDGQPKWVFDGHELGMATAAGVIGRDGHKESADLALHHWTIDQIHVGAYDPKVRLAVLDECGIDAQIIFPSTIGLGGQDLGAVEDEALCRLVIELYNDQMAEIQADSGNRLLPMPIMPAWDVDTCIAEAKRVAALGARGV